MFNYTENITVPKLTDIFNNSSDLPVPIFQMFTHAWIWFMGGWFFAAVIGVIGAALYEKYDNVLVPTVFFMITLAFFGPVLRATPLLSGMPSAEYFTYMLGLLVALGIGLSFYRLFINKKG